MPWFTDALQEIRTKSSNLTQQVAERGSTLQKHAREHARGIAAKTQQLEEVVVSNLSRPVSAQDLQARLEDEAKKLTRPGPAADVLQRWTDSFTSFLRYPSQADPSSSTALPENLTFHQVFLRSRALEFAIDQVFPQVVSSVVQFSSDVLFSCLYPCPVQF